MASFILNALGFRIESGVLIPPNAHNFHEDEKIRLGFKQIKERLEGKKGICVTPKVR
jgi:ethanolamine utilization cobalamin adenosyltransferase